MKRDGEEVQADWNKIYMTNGASEGVRHVMRLVIRSSRDGVLVPIPQYPLYSALITLNQGTMVKYFLDEEKNWGINAEDIQQRIKNARDLGINIRCMTVINPGNPTGNVLKREDIEDIIKICYEERILLLADEVYQQNIYHEHEFHSVRKVLAELGPPYSNNVEVVSLHSTSKGLMGECGLRGGYFEFHNMDSYAEDMIRKLKAIELCANSVGQVATMLMVDPPKEGRESESTLKLYNQQKGDIKAGLQERATIVEDNLRTMTHVSCSNIEGSIYAFPKIVFQDKALKRARKMGISPDFMYCMDLLQQTGVMVVPGSGFGQKEGTHHIRLTNLICPNGEMQECMTTLRNFNDKFHDKYS